MHRYDLKGIVARQYDNIWEKVELVDLGVLDSPEENTIGINLITL